MSYLEKFKTNDPEFYELFNRFSKETINEVTLDPKDHYLSVLGILLGSSSDAMYEALLPEALEVLTPEEVKEVLYQAVAYIGMGRIYPFFDKTNRVFEKLEIDLPVANATTTTEATRLEAGNQKQVDLFGPHMDGFYKKDTISSWLAKNCFGDYYTRLYLDNRQREMITFCFLAGQGTELQLKSHIQANVRNGNSREFLIAVALHCMPYIGYPRTLNTLRCIDEALKD